MTAPMLVIATLLCLAVAAESPNVFATLELWARDNGAEIANVGIASAADYGQVLALRQPVPAGHLLLSVPESLVLSSDLRAMATHVTAPLGPALRDAVEGLPAQHRVALLLLHHAWAAEDSFWGPYLDALPRSLEAQLPLAWPAEAALWLADTPAAHSVQAQQLQVENDYDRYVAPLLVSAPELFPAATLTRDAWRWAVSIVLSRAFRHVSEGEEVFSLVPLLDMANHRPRAHMDGPTRQSFLVRDPEQRARFVYAPKDMSLGEQFFSDYGVLTNEVLLIHYGMVLRDNGDDYEELRLPLAEDPDSLLVSALLSTSLASLPDVENGYISIKLTRQGVSQRDLALLRLMLAGESELAMAQRVAKGQPISAANDEAVFGLLSPALAEALEAVNQLPSATAGSNHPNIKPLVPLVAMRYREEYKKLLSASLDSLQRQLQPTGTTDAEAQHEDAHPEL